MLTTADKLWQAAGLVLPLAAFLIAVYVVDRSERRDRARRNHPARTGRHPSRRMPF